MPCCDVSLLGMCIDLFLLDVQQRIKRYDTDSFLVQCKFIT